MDVLYPHAKFGGDRFTTAMWNKNESFCASFLLFCHAGHGLFWSLKPAATFGIFRHLLIDFHCIWGIF